MKINYKPVLGIAAFLLLWQTAAFIIQAESILPMPYKVLTEVFYLLKQASTLQAAMQTIGKVLFTLVLVLSLGIILGLIMGIFKPIYEIFRPVILVIQAVPVISWLSLVIFAWGIGFKGPVFIAFISLLPISLLTTVSGVNSLDKNLLEMAKVYQVPRIKILKDIYLGSLIPFIIAIIDVTLGQAWKVVLVAEYLSGNSGLGVKILSARYVFDPVKVWAYTLIAVLLGLITERIIKHYLGRIAEKWTSS